MPAGTPREVAEILGAQRTAFRDATVDYLLRRLPRLRRVAPLRQRRRAEALTERAVSLVARSPRGLLRGEDAAALERAGRANRRLGVPLRVYPVLAQALKAGLRAAFTAAGEPYTAAARDAEALAEAACASLARGAYAADLAGVPAATAGEVITVEHPTRTITALTVDTGAPVPRLAGQRLPATTPLAGGEWAPLSPAGAPDDSGQLTFFLHRATHPVYRRLADARVGDQVLLGEPEGGLSVPAGPAPATIVALDEGYAAARALVFELLGSEEPPETHLIIETRYPGEHVELARLEALATAASWLSVTAVSREEADPWWLAARESGGHVRRGAAAVAAVIDSPAVADRAVRLIGPAALAEPAARDLRAAGVRDLEVAAWADPA
ncbi:hypothetical protein [Corynebacterium otitidis]|uniref:hypothetical protein n=1 Tax=Corynebacterium otitidis TaxID=29321 RepID=UPI000627AB87|nr:hypothetical protein [Corynebacterium otitidis]KKO83246.1 hypothetical protein AAV33_07505 [Corynebacterium otitidis]